MIDQGAIVYNCPSTNNWCCDVNLKYQGCCSDTTTLLYLSAASTVSSTSTTATSSSSSSSALSTTTTLTSNSQHTATPTQASTSTPSLTPSANNLGVKVGAGLGIPAGLALIGALAYIIYLRRKHRRSIRDSNPPAWNQGYTGEIKSQPQQPISYYSEATAPSEVAESRVQLGEQRTSELHGDGIERLREDQIRAE